MERDHESISTGMHKSVARGAASRKWLKPVASQTVSRECAELRRRDASKEGGEVVGEKENEKREVGRYTEMFLDQWRGCTTVTVCKLHHRLHLESAHRVCKVLATCSAHLWPLGTDFYVHCYVHSNGVPFYCEHGSPCTVHISLDTESIHLHAESMLLLHEIRPLLDISKKIRTLKYFSQSDGYQFLHTQPIFPRRHRLIKRDLSCIEAGRPPALIYSIFYKYAGLLPYKGERQR